MKSIKLIIYLAFIFSFHAYSQSAYTECKTATKTIKAVYRGKNLFFQNTLPDGIQKILIDNKVVVSACTSTVFELPLSGMRPNQKFELKIIYCSTTKNAYKIVNPEVIK